MKKLEYSMAYRNTLEEVFMIQNGVYQLATVHKLAFNRQGGTEDERRAAQIIRDEIASFGGTSSVEPFQIPRYDMKKVSLKVTKPFVRELQVHGVGFTGSTPEEGIEAELYYAEDVSDMKLKNAAGKILLLNEGIYGRWQEIVNSGAVGYIIISGEFCDDPERVDLPRPYLRKRFTEKGTIPGMVIRTRDAMALLKDGATHVHFAVVQEEREAESGNVVAQIKGSKETEEFILLTAHYDSVPYSIGAWDNASGSADLLALYAYFTENPPPVTMRFVWLGSEELGLLGSKSYVAAHGEELKQCRLNLNLDMTGVVIGHDETDIIAEESLEHMVQYLAREVGFDTVCKRIVRSSDCAVFADAGIPAIDFVRRGKGVVHNRYDLEFPLSEETFARTQTFMRQFLCRVMNSVEFPIPRVIPQDMRELLDRYFYRTPNP